MSLFSKRDTEGDTLGSGTGWVKRSLKKIIYGLIMTIAFGVYKLGVSGRIIDVGIKNGVPWQEVISVAFIKALQKGTLDAPTMLFQGVVGFFTYPVTNLFRNIIPFLMVYGVWFQFTSVIVDILDMRKEDTVGFVGKMLASLGVMFLVYAIYTGVAVFDPTPLTFNATEVAVRKGWIEPAVNQSVNLTAGNP